MLGSENPEKKRLSPGGSCSTSAIYVGGLKDTEALFQQVSLQGDLLADHCWCIVCQAGGHKNCASLVAACDRLKRALL